WDQKGYYATQVATEIMGSAPLVGPYVQTFVQGGTSYGHHTLTRFFALHAGLLPALLIGFLALHIYVFRRHSIHAVVVEGREEGMFWPDQVLKDAVACLAVLAAILTATWYWHGAELTAPANPAEAYSAARPEWYYLFLFRFLKFPLVSQLGEYTHLGEAFGAIVVPGIAMTFIILMPLIAHIRGGHRFNVAFLWVMIGIAGVLTGIAYYEDWYADTPEGQNFRQAVSEAHRDGARVVALANSPTGIPPEGALTLFRTDPLTQGPAVFSKYCLSCHQPAEEMPSIKDTPTAPPLADPRHREESYFASRDWIRSVLMDFGTHFERLKNIEGDRAEPATAILEGSMLTWSQDNAETLQDEANKADFEALVEFLYAQSRRPDALSPVDEIVERGKQIFISGEMSSGSIDACVDCHSMHALTVVNDQIVLEEEALSEDLQPILTGYGSTAWLKAFISDPQAHYAGEYGNNAMPAFADQLSELELDLVARWLAKDYYLPGGEAVAEH
ncbi:MAG: cytochrome b N-terminal domain-containing protein, partial [Planctomycetaceae bacterium]|nr:cytochrome b N-terminal domain-containing protein [Planctomycetaceae bacterium]